MPALRLAGAALPKKGRFYERNQCFSRSAHRSVQEPAARLEAQAETAVGRVSITNDVPVLRIGHVSIEGALLGMWQAAFRPVLHFKEINAPWFTIQCRVARSLGCEQL